jgi:hypothetical protein
MGSETGKEMCLLTGGCEHAAAHSSNMLDGIESV